MLCLNFCALSKNDIFRQKQTQKAKMAAAMKKTAAEVVNVTFEDQQKINKFARNTSRITELKEEIEVKKVVKKRILFKERKRSLYYSF